MLPATKRIREAALQAHLIRKVREKGHFAVKITSPSRKGMPDVVVIVNGRVTFVEVKMATRSKPDPIQSLTHREMLKARANVTVLKGLEDVNQFLFYL